MDKDDEDGGDVREKFGAEVFDVDWFDPWLGEDDELAVADAAAAAAATETRAEKGQPRS